MFLSVEKLGKFVFCKEVLVTTAEEFYFFEEMLQSKLEFEDFRNSPDLYVYSAMVAVDLCIWQYVIYVPYSLHSEIVSEGLQKNLEERRGE